MTAITIRVSLPLDAAQRLTLERRLGCGLLTPERASSWAEAVLRAELARAIESKKNRQQGRARLRRVHP